MDQDQAIATYQSGTHLLNYAYPAQHSGVATIDALLPDYNGFSAWDTAAAGTIIPYSFMDATLHYLDSASYADATDATTRGVYDADILELSDAQGGTLTLDRFNVTPAGTGQPDLTDLTIDVSNFAYLGACGSADFCSNAAHYAFTSTGSIPDGTTATGRVLGGIFGPNGENAGALLDASNANTIEFRGDFVARRNP